MAFVLTRPLGATFDDLLTEAAQRAIVILAQLVLQLFRRDIIGFVIYALVQENRVD